MNEAAFTRKIHKYLPKQIYVWKISDRFTAGIADAYYSGETSDLWIEYKFERNTPVRYTYPKLSELQKRWLRNRHAEGRNVATVIGYENGTAVIIEGDEFEVPVSPDNFISHKQVAKYIEKKVCG